MPCNTLEGVVARAKKELPEPWAVWRMPNGPRDFLWTALPSDPVLDVRAWRAGWSREPVMFAGSVVAHPWELNG